MVLKTKSRFRNKKTFYFLGLIAMLVFLTACTGAARLESQTRHLPADSVNPPPPYTTAERGIQFSISRHSTLNVDVERIVDYVQGESMMVGEDRLEDHNTPWICLHWLF